MTVRNQKTDGESGIRVDSQEREGAQAASKNKQTKTKQKKKSICKTEHLMIER